MESDERVAPVSSVDAELAPAMNTTTGVEEVEADGGPSGAAAERLNWRKNSAVLYDLFVNCSLEWPALSVAWLPDEPDENCRLAFGTHTDGSTTCEVVVAELVVEANAKITGDPWQSWPRNSMGDMEGFGCHAPNGTPLRVLARLRHPTEVNKLAPCPHRAQLLATKAATGEVLLFDYRAERSAEDVAPDAVLKPPSLVDGFALDWSPTQRHTVASGGNDGRLCIWDADAALTSSTSPLHNFAAHTGALCDLSFSHYQPQVLLSVGDDKQVCLFDMRAGSTSQLSVKVSEDEALTVDCSQHSEHLLATSGKDKVVRVWDTRTFREPLHNLRGHRGDVVVVRWAPFRTDLLASCSSDSRLIMWNLSPEDTDEAREDDESAELLFAHGGHSQGVSDFSWGSDDFLMCSVSEDNSLHIWQPNSVLYLEDSDDAGDDDDQVEPPTKRVRSEVTE